MKAIEKETMRGVMVVILMMMMAMMMMMMISAAATCIIAPEPRILTEMKTTSR